MDKRFINETTAIIPIVLLAAFIWYFFAPGYMSSDSFVQYGSALEGVYPDNHPVIMSYIWHYLMKVIPGPQSLLIFHTLLLMGGIYFWHKNSASKLTSLAIVLLFMMPWVINFAGVLWKDVGMAFALLAGSALLLNSKGNKKIALASAPFLLYALAVRYNSILAIIPMVFMGLVFILPRTAYWKSVLITIAIVVVSFLFVKFVTYNVIHAERKNYEVLLMGDDIAKISAETQQTLLPNIKDSDLQACTPMPILYERALCFIARGYDKNGILTPEMPYKEVRKLWLDTILANPLLYAEMKVTAFLYFLRDPSLEPVTSWLPGINKNIYHLVVSRPEMVKKLEGYVMGAQQSFLGEFFKPYIWLIISLLMLPAALLIKKSAPRSQIIALNLSSLGCFFSLLLAVPSVDFRYSYWCIIAATVSLVIFGTALADKNKQAATM